MNTIPKIELKEKNNAEKYEKNLISELNDRTYVILSNFDNFVYKYTSEHPDKNIRKTSKKVFNNLYKLYKQLTDIENENPRIQRVQFIPRRFKNPKK